MKKLFLFLILLAFEPRLATAQVVKTAIVPEKVTYSRTIPKSLRAFVPRGGKTRFWGATNLKYNRQRVWVHVYDAQKMSADGHQKEGVDLLVLHKSQRLVRVSSTRFEYEKWPAETINIETLYLDPKTKKRPIVRLAVQNSNEYGPIANYVFVIFSTDFKTPIIQKQFGHGNSNASDYPVWNTSFGVDERGLLTIVYYQGGTGGDRITTYGWNENLFRPFERKQQKEMGENNPFFPVSPTND